MFCSKKKRSAAGEPQTPNPTVWRQRSTTEPLHTQVQKPCLEVIKLEFILRLKVNSNDVSASSQSLRFILSLRLYLSFITQGALCGLLECSSFSIPSSLTVNSSISGQGSSFGS